MTNHKWTAQELADKIYWEGGVLDAIVSYGLGSELLPEDTPEAVVEAWKGLETQTRLWERTIEAWLPEEGEEGEDE